MTDNPDKVHPVILAAAQKIREGKGPLVASPERLADPVWREKQESRLMAACIADAKAAAKVLLEMLPTEAMLIAGSEGNPTVWNDETDAGFGLSVANDVYVAMTAAARSEMGV